MKTLVIHSLADAHRLSSHLEAPADRLRRNLRRLLDCGESAMRLLARLKFEETGFDPLDAERPLNLIEQVNQSLTYEATFQAAAWLVETHPEHAPVTLHLGTSRGIDIVSQDGKLLAEVFAAVDPRNNRKLEKDIDRLRAQVAPLKYVLYMSPTTGGKPEQYEVDGVRVRRLTAYARYGDAA